MSGRTFIDTAVLVWTIDTSSVPTHDEAIDRLAEEEEAGRALASPAILGEFFNALTKPRRAAPDDGKPRPPLRSRADAELVARELARRMPMHLVTPEIVLDGIALLQKHKQLKKTWDAIHLATAIASGCTLLLTCDSHFPDGDSIEGVEIRHLARSRIPAGMN